ncbi:hypothetical protein HDR66_01890 [bacterium]|nr:hypothetical protein [bacterium]
MKKLGLVAFSLLCMLNLGDAMAAVYKGGVYSCVANWGLFDVAPSTADMADLRSNTYRVGGAGKCSDGMANRAFSSDEYFFTKVHEPDSVGIIECDDSHVPQGSFIYYSGKIWTCNDGTNWYPKDGAFIEDCPQNVKIPKCSKVGEIYLPTAAGSFDGVRIYKANDMRPCKCRADNIESKTQSGNANNNAGASAGVGSNNAVINVNMQNERACADSGGTWSNTCICPEQKNLKTQGNVCVCSGADYEFVSSTKECKKTSEAERRTVCEDLIASGAAGNPKWDGKKCVCGDEKYQFKDGKCVMFADIAKCENISDAKWDAANGCVCDDADKVVNDDITQCVESDAARARREAAIAAEQKVSKSKITDVIEKMGTLTGGLNTSVWKTADGNFNGARLASDGIAGVVLGTAGGLITSNVVKKNQIKHGFEDIKCSIGGQTVADYGDDFAVGVK